MMRVYTLRSPGLWFLSGFLAIAFSMVYAESHVAPQEPFAPTAPVAPKMPALKQAAPQNIKPVSKAGAEHVVQTPQDQHQARWNPIHFKPAIDKASNEQCLACHSDVLEDKVLETSPAGVKANEALAWYQTLDTYEGEQQTFHQRHLTSKMAKQLMDLKCSTCHQGHDPGVEISYLIQSGQVKQKIRKLVDPDICVMCHGKFDASTMPGLAGDWIKVRDTYNNNCNVCHAIFRTRRHQVNYLNPDAIEKAGDISGDSCYGCHGGRAWYNTAYKYPRHRWPGMSLLEPDWAKTRPKESNPRFLQGFDPFKEKNRIKKQIMQKLEEIEILQDSMK